MLYETNLSEEQRSRLRKLAWTTFAKFATSAAAAIGAKLGEWAVEYLRGDEEDDDEEPEV